MSKKVAVILVPGTWETRWKPGDPDTESPTGMLKLVSDKLNADTYIAASIKYMAKFGDPDSYKVSKTHCYGQILRVVLALPPGTPFILVGYSQGADAAGDFARNWWRSNGSPELCLALYNIADPRRNAGDLVGPPVGGCGVLGERGHMFNHPVYEFCAPGDLIACSNREKELSYIIAPAAIGTGLRSPLGWAEYGFGILRNKKALRELGLERFAGLGGLIKLTRLATQTSKALQYYINSNVHANYGRYELNNGQTVPEWIADSMNRLDYMLVQERLNTKPKEG